MPAVKTQDCMYSQVAQNLAVVAAKAIVNRCRAAMFLVIIQSRELRRRRAECKINIGSVGFVSYEKPYLSNVTRLTNCAVSLEFSARTRNRTK